MAGKQNYKITGKSMYAKVFGEPQDNYQGDKREWTIDIEPDEASRNQLERLGVGGKIRHRDGRPDFLTFSRTEFKSQKFGGGANQPIPVLDKDGKPWPADVSIGNGSTIEIKFGLLEYAAFKKRPAGVKAIIYEIKVLDLVHYQRPTKAEGSQKPAATDEEDYS